MTANNEEINTQQEENIEEETEMEEDVQYNENAKWLEAIFTAPGFSKWRANKALEEGKEEKYITNLLVDYNLKIKKCNDIADFIVSHCDPKEALKKKPAKKDDPLKALMKQANKKYWSVVGKDENDKKPTKKSIPNKKEIS